MEADAEVDPRTVHYDWKEYSMDAWQGGARPNLRTSLIVDPPDGRLPPMTPEAQKRREAAAGGRQAKKPGGRHSDVRQHCTRGAFSGLAPIPLMRGGNPGAESALRLRLA